MTSAVDASLPGVRSPGPPETVTELWIVPPAWPASTVAVIASDAVAPFASVPTDQTVPFHAPCEALDETSVSPAGRVSATETALALLGPWFVTVIA